MATQPQLPTCRELDDHSFGPEDIASMSAAFEAAREVRSMEKSIVNEVVSALEAVKSSGQPGFWILLVSILIVLVLVIAAVVYQRIVIKRFQTPSKATQENFEAIAADLRKRALEVKKQDEGLRKRELEVKERKQQQQVLKRSQRALKGSVSHTMLQTDFKGMTSVVPDSSTERHG